MRIEPYNTNNINTQSVGEKETFNISKSTIADIVSFGSSEGNIFNKDTKKNSMLAGADGTSVSVKEQAEILKNSLNAIFNKMDTGRMVEINEEGIDVNNEESHKIVTVVEQIQIKLAAYCDDFQATVDIDADKVRQIIGDGAKVYKIAQGFAESGVLPTQENVSDAMEAFDMAESVGKLDDNMKAYMIQNQLAPTINNIYIAAYSGYNRNIHNISEEQWAEMAPQVEKILSDSDIAVTTDNVNKGRWMIDNDIEVTADNFNRLAELEDAERNLNAENIIERIAAGMTEGFAAKDSVISSTKYPWENAVKAVKTLEKTTPENLMYLIASHREITLENLAIIQENNGVEKPDEANIKYARAYRNITEARILMTISAARVMEQNGISVNTEPLSELVDKLKEYEIQSSDNMPETPEMTDRTVNAMYEIEMLKMAPAAVIGRVVAEKEAPTVANLNSHIKEKAAGAYEALSTEIRSDLGDRLYKAVSASTPDILNNLGYEDNDVNRRAVRILAYNGMEVNEQNIDAVKNIDLSVNVLFRNMQPGKVLEMIREGIDPLNTPVDELSDYLEEMNATVDNVEKYSEFLYRMEKKHTISAEEREKFIGIYSLVNKFRKDGMNAAGQLINQGLELTMGNLLSAYMSRNHRNMELTADDVTPIVAADDKLSYYKKLFNSVKDKITPDYIESVTDEFAEMSPEQFVQKADEYNDENQEVYERYMETIRETATMEEQIYKFVTDNNVTATYNNLLAVKTLFTQSEKMWDGIDGEERLMEALTDKDSAQKEYDGLVDQAKELINQAMYSDMSYMDMEKLRLLGNNMSLMTNLARKNNYYFPYDNNGTKGIINLRIIDNSENKGEFSVSINDGKGTHTYVKGRVDHEVISAGILCDSRESEEKVVDRLDNIKNKLTAKGFETVRVNYGYTDGVKDGVSSNIKGVSDRQIFAVAGIFIDELTN